MDFTISDITVESPGEIVRRDLPFVEDYNTNIMGRELELCGARVYKIVATETGAATIEGT